MATREEVLLGFQLIDAINAGNDVTYNAACYLRSLEPLTLVPLKAYTADQDSAQEATVEDIKSFTEDGCKLIDIEIDTRLVQFLARFPDQQAVNRGLAAFKTGRGVLDRDISEVRLHRDSVRNVQALVDSKAAMRPHGELLSLYREQVDSRVDYLVHVPAEHRNLNELQDLLNVIGFELQGMCSYTGQGLNLDLPSLVELVSARIAAARTVTASSNEASRFLGTLRKVEDALGTLTTLQEAESLGQLVDSEVPRLPLLRRWWCY